MTSDQPRRFPWVLTVLVAVGVAVLVALGTWQVQRMQWKQDLIAQAAEAATAPPGSPAEVFSATDPEFRTVTLACPGLASAPFVELQTIHEGRPGVRLISACRPADHDQTLLVDRGFIDAGISARPSVSPSGSPVELVAEVRRTPAPGPMSLAPEDGRFFARDNAAMARALGVEGPAAPWTLYALDSSNPDWTALEPSAPPAAFSNDHLGYALTWFGLALALAGFYVAMLRRRSRP